MKKIFSALFFTLFGAAALMTSCSDVPAPYEIKSPDDVDLVGTGTKEDPYNVATAQMKQDGSVAWVQGYIVGVMETNVDPFTANFAAPFSTSSNLMIADNPDEEKSKNCLMVQLPTGDIRTALNLVDHADNLKQPVILQGTLTSYFSAAGLKDVSAGVFKGEEIGGEQEVDGAYINESFKTDLGVFTSYSVEGSLKWENDYSSAMIKGGSATGKFPSDTWLVAKSVDLSKEDKAYITFDHAINYASGATLSDYHKLVISKDYDGSGVAGIKNAHWDEIAVKMPSGSSFDFVNTGKVAVPAEYLGQGKVTVALHYISTSEVGTTWEVQNFVMAHGDAEEVPEPGTPEAENTKDTAYDVTKALTLTENNGTKIAWVKGYIVGGVSSDNSASQVDGPEDVVFGTESVRNSAILIAASKEETDYTKCMVIGFGSDSPEAKTALNLVDHPENLGKEVVLCGTLKYAFSAPGMKTITEFELKNGGTEPEPGTGDLFISEYVEGSDNNKYIEIYNPTDNAIDLSAYALDLNTNGGATWSKDGTGYKNYTELSGSLPAKSVIVYKNSKAEIYEGEATVCNAVNFNGNDPVGLFKNGELIDIFGSFGAGSADFAKDMTFRRKSSVTGPSATYNADEWEATSKDDVSGLGSHTMN